MCVKDVCVRERTERVRRVHSWLWQRPLGQESTPVTLIRRKRPLMDVPEEPPDTSATSALQEGLLLDLG